MTASSAQPPDFPALANGHPDDGNATSRAAPSPLGNGPRQEQIIETNTGSPADTVTHDSATAAVPPRPESHHASSTSPSHLSHSQSPNFQQSTPDNPHKATSTISDTRPDTPSPRSSRASSLDESAHQRYVESLPIPTVAETRRIAAIQEKKEKEIDQKYAEKRAALEALGDGSKEAAANVLSDEQRWQAASIIQRNYRGHRTRRQLQGLSLDPSSRWVDAIKEARYRQLTTPRPKDDEQPGASDEERATSPIATPKVRSRWQRLGRIAQHAHGEGNEIDSSDSDPEDATLPPNAERRHAKHKAEEAWKGKMMDLPYFLEMVDLKHRYGSNLRRYHAEWMKTDSHENFFYWLDHGAGREVEIPKVSRQRLESEQVRYLSREERLQYLVNIDTEGRLCWHKNGQRIDTGEEFRDSVEGIVPREASAKQYREDEIRALHHHSSDEDGEGDEDDASDGSSGSSSEAERRYPDPEGLAEAKGVRKVAHVSAAAVLNRLLRRSVKKNTWIFVADVNMNLYVGIKQSGAFQHSSFLRGARIAAAGLIKVKRGQLRQLSPLSGHYRPPAAAFRHFVKHLEAQHVDMHRVSISRSYAVLVGLEAYLGGKKRVQDAKQTVRDSVDQVIHPAEHAARVEQARDKSQSAALEARVLREQEEERERQRHDALLGTSRTTSHRNISHGNVNRIDTGTAASLKDKVVHKFQTRTASMREPSTQPTKSAIDQHAVDRPTDDASASALDRHIDSSATPSGTATAAATETATATATGARTPTQSAPAILPERPKEAANQSIQEAAPEQNPASS